MQLLFSFALLAATGFILWSLIGVIFSKGRRRKKLMHAGLGFALFLIAAPFVENPAEEKAHQAGFENSGEQSAAAKAGVTDPTIWKVRKSDAQQQADAEKAKGEAEAKALAQAAAEKAALDAKAKEAQCRQDIRCWAEDAFAAASVACPEAVQSLAKWDYEWTDGWLEPKLEQYRWKDQKRGVVTFIGTKIKFQNGFGAWKRMTYFCDYDPIARQVISVSAR